MSPLEHYEGVDIIELVTKIQKIKSMDDLPALVMLLESAGDITGAAFIDNWFASLEYHKMAEWDVSIKENHPIPYPDCVEKGCEKHPWVM